MKKVKPEVNRSFEIFLNDKIYTSINKANNFAYLVEGDKVILLLGAEKVLCSLNETVEYFDLESKKEYLESIVKLKEQILDYKSKYLESEAKIIELEKKLEDKKEINIIELENKIEDKN